MNLQREYPERMSPTLQLMRKVGDLSRQLKACNDPKKRGVLFLEIARLKSQIDVLIDERNERLRRASEAKYGPSTNTYSQATVDFEDACGFRYN